MSTPTKRRYFDHIGSSSVKKVADRYKHVIIITGLFQATRPIANTNNTKLHTQKTLTNTQTYIRGK